MIAEPSARPSSALSYVETSALLADLLNNDVSARHAIGVSGRNATSALTVAEAYRTLIAERARGTLSPTAERKATRALETFFARCHLVSVSEDILRRAGRAFPIEPVRALDAIHLATIESLGYPPALVTVVTRDRRVRENALALGCQVE